jgi:hypothetical protein
MADLGVHIGYWRDYSADAGNQHVLTLPLRWAGFLISALALLVSLAGGSFWTIMAYILHQSRVPHHTNIAPAQLQLQVLLRNAATPFSAVLDLISILWAWPKTTGSLIRRRAIALMAVALVSFVAFTVAGVFVAAIASNSEANIIALAKPGTCGLWELGYNNSDILSYQAFVRGAVSTALRSRAYARAWYTETPSSVAPQSYFLRQTLPYTTYHVQCPFKGENRCLSNDSSNSAMVWDTGRLNSHTHLGINAPADHTIDWRWVLTCSPVSTWDLHRRKKFGTGELFILDVGTGGGVKNAEDGIFVWNSQMAGDLITYTVRQVTRSAIAREKC